MKKLILLAALALGLTFSAAIAQPGPGMGQKGQRGHGRNFDKPGMGRGMNMLPDLTEEQQSKIEDLHISFYKSVKPTKDKLAELKVKMRTLSTAEKVDMGDINDLIDEIGALKIKLAKMQAAHHQKVRELLTEKQRIIFDQHRGRGDGMGRGNGMGQRGGNGPR